MRRTSRFAALTMAALLGTTGCDDGDDLVVALDGGADASLDAGALDLDGGMDATVTSDAGTATQPVTIKFKAKIGGRDLVCGESYEVQGSMEQGSTKVSVTPQDFRFYVEEVRLVSAEGREERVVFDVVEGSRHQARDVALLDFTDDKGSCVNGDPTINTQIIGKVAPGSYRDVVLVVGVPESLNHIAPTQAPAPLQAPGASWDWNVGYRFFMAELVQAGSADAGAPALGNGLFHLGSASCSGSQVTGYQCARPNRAEVRLAGFNPVSNSIVADLGAVFADTDLSKPVACHGTMPPCAPMFQAVGVDLDGGTPLPTQTVFSVE